MAGHLSRAWAAASVAAVRARREKAAAAAPPVGLAGLAAQAAGLGLARAVAAGDDGRRQAGADESLRRAMYLSCWGPS